MNDTPPQNEQDDEWGPLVTPRRRWWIDGVLAIVVVLLGLGYLPHILPHGRDPTRRDTIHNAREVLRALSAFKNDYGSYPNEDTIAEVLKRHPEAMGLLGKTSSNDFFRQLIVAGYVDGEQPFFMGRRRSQDVAKDKVSGRMLEAGECGFSYVVWKTDEKIPEHAPILMIPLIPGQLAVDPVLTETKFNRVMIIGYCDGSVELRYIHHRTREGKVYNKVLCDGGLDFFDLSSPHWGEKPPRIAWPE